MSCTHTDHWSQSRAGTSGYGASNIESARQKLAGSLVNGFVNTSFGQDKWMTSGDVSQHIYTNKDHGKMTAAASLGLVQLWDVDHGLGQIDKVY
jgi:26S proteasome regulatory subunit N1